MKLACEGKEEEVPFDVELGQRVKGSKGGELGD